MTQVLGIGWPVHDSSAALVNDGSLTAAVAEGRLSRIKYDGNFPVNAINYALDTVAEPDLIACSTASNTPPGRRVRNEIKHAKDVRSKADAFVKIPYRELTKSGPDMTVAANLVEYTNIGLSEGEILDRLEYVDHHRAHAASAYFTSGFDTATVVTVDGAGDGLSSTVYRASNGTIERIAANDDRDSIGLVWVKVLVAFGFKGITDAGKFMGMAAYADTVPESLRAEFRDLIQIDGTEITCPFVREVYEKEGDERGDSWEQGVRRLRQRLDQYEAPEVAKALQDRTEVVLSELVRTAVAETGYDNVALAGGVAGNVRANQYIYELDKVKELFVHQAMGDSGIGAGAALDIHAETSNRTETELLTDIYLGPDIDQTGIDRAIETTDIAVSCAVHRYSNEELARRAAKKLADGDVVCVFRDRLEYGPRALGNRSILYQATDDTAIEWLNDRLNRSEFMPFAPVTLADHATECYMNMDLNTCPAARYMTVTFNCTETMRERSPGAVHIDGTARPQIITDENNPFYHRILQEYYEQTGIPTVINTSFNIHGEPIVSRAIEAIRSFQRTGNSALIINSRLITRDG